MGERLYSGGDDRSIIIWNIESGKLLEQLYGHENGITSIAFAFGDLWTGSFDHQIYSWDLDQIEDRLQEKEDMREADVESRRYEVYWRVMTDKKAGKKSKKAGKVVGAKKAAKKEKKGKK